MAEHSRFTAAGAYAEYSVDDVRFTTAGAYAEYSVSDARFTTAGAYLEYSTALSRFSQVGAYVEFIGSVTAAGTVSGGTTGAITTVGLMSDLEDMGGQTNITSAGLFSEVEHALEIHVSTQGLMLEAMEQPAAGDAIRITTAGLMVEGRPGREVHESDCLDFYVYDRNENFLAFLNGAWNKSVYIQLNGAGSFSFVFSRHDPKWIADSSIFVHGNIIKVRYRNQIIFKGILEHRYASQVETGGTFQKVFTISGRGMLAKLENAVIYPDSIGSPSGSERTFTGTRASMIIDLMEEAQARDTIRDLFWEFTDTVDTEGALWTDSQSLGFRVGENYLNIVRKFSTLGTDVYYDPLYDNLQMFVEQGEDKSDSVHFLEGRNIITSERTTDSDDIRNVVLIEGQDTSYAEDENATAVAGWGERREGYLSMQSVSDATTRDEIATSWLTRKKELSLQYTIEVTGHNEKPYTDYWIGDYVSLGLSDVATTSYRIHGIGLEETSPCTVKVTLDLNSIRMETAIKQARILESLTMGTTGNMGAATDTSTPMPDTDPRTIGESEGSIDHNQLDNVDSGDVHTQYLLATGTRDGATGQAQQLARGLSLDSGYNASWTVNPSYPTTVNRLEGVTVDGHPYIKIKSWAASNALIDSANVTLESRDKSNNYSRVVASEGGVALYSEAGPVTATRMIIQPSAAASVPLTIKGAAAQSANWLELQTSAGVDILTVSDEQATIEGGSGAKPGWWVERTDASGGFVKVHEQTGIASRFYPAIDMSAIGTQYSYSRMQAQIASANDSGTVPVFDFICRTNAGLVGTRPLWQVSNYTTAIMLINASGHLGVGETSPGAQLHVTPSGAAVIGQIIEGDAAQSANLFEAHDSSSNVLNFMGATGGATLGDYNAGDYAQIDDNGSLLFVGAGGMQYGEISVVSNSTETAIASSGVAVQVTIFDTNGPSNGTTPDHTNDHITIATAGDYFIAVSATVNSVAGASSRFEMTVQKNNGAADVGALHCDRNIAGGGGVAGVISMSGLAALAASDTIEVWIENETNTANYVVEDITLTLIQVGG